MGKRSSQAKPPRERDGWRWALYRAVTGPLFPAVRLAIWMLQIPLVVAMPSVAAAVMYVTILSIAAGVESSLTDYVEALKFQEDEASPQEPLFEPE